MKVRQYTYRDNAWDQTIESDPSAQWVMIFGDRHLVSTPDIQNALQSSFPNAERVGCSTSGEIIGEQVQDGSLVVTAVTFTDTQVACMDVNIDSYVNSHEVAVDLAQGLSHENLRYVLVLSDGQKVNGSELVAGLKEQLPADVLITGGLAGDDSRFQETMVWRNEKCESGLVLVLGFYGDSLTIGHGSIGGWDTFGPSRLITKSKANCLYKLDGVDALELYKKYLGEYAKELPASALLFPLAVSEEEEGDYVVRTILNIDEQNQCMVFAGDVPQGQYAKLMRANFDRLIDGAQSAASHSVTSLDDAGPELAILISCVGRRLVLNQRVEEELEEVKETLGERCFTTGFYSYGEISPLSNTNDCRLHNQTMTITTFSEHPNA